METKEPKVVIESEAQSPVEEKKSGLYPTIIDILALFALYMLSLGVGLFGVYAVISDGSFDQLSSVDNANLILWGSIISNLLFIVIVSIFRRCRKGVRPKLKFGSQGFNANLICLGFYMMLSTSIVIDPLMSILPPVSPIEARGWQLLVGLVVVAPLFEEIICRGILFESMRSKWGLFTAWLGSSLFFALMHGEVAAIINAFFMGLILGYFAIRSGSLLAPIILHAMNNAVAYIFFLMGWGSDVRISDLIKNESVYIALYIVAVVVLVVSTVLCARRFKKIINQNNSTQQQTLQ